MRPRLQRRPVGRPRSRAWRTKSASSSRACRPRRRADAVQPGGLLGGGVAPPGRPVVGPAFVPVVSGHLRSLRPRGVAWKPASSSARPSGESSTPAPSARSTVSRPSWPSRTASDSASTAGCSRCRVLGPGEQGAPAALDVQHQAAVDEHDQGAGLAARACGRRPRRRRGRPRQRGAERVGRVGGREHQGARRRRAPLARGSSSARSSAAPHGAQPVDRAGQRELRGAEALDEVAAPAAPGLLERREHPVDRGEPAGRPLGHHRAADHHAVPVEQHLGQRRGPPGGVGLDLGQQRPATGRRRRPGAAGHRRAGRGRSGRAGPARRALWAPPPATRVRSGARVSLVTCPAQTRSQSAATSVWSSVRLRPTSDEPPEEERAAAGQRVERPPGAPGC